MKYRKLLKFIKQNRLKGNSHFTMLTTADELIIIAKNINFEDVDQIRIKYK